METINFFLSRKPAISKTKSRVRNFCVVHISYLFLHERNYFFFHCTTNYATLCILGPCGFQQIDDAYEKQDSVASLNDNIARNALW